LPDDIVSHSNDKLVNADSWMNLTEFGITIRFNPDEGNAHRSMRRSCEFNSHVIS
jgi:hypothetical protein